MTARRIIKKVGITGKRGFIGGAVAKALSGEGHKVISLDDALRGRVSAGVKSRWKPGALDWVLHFAAKTSIEDSFKDPFSTYADNLEATLAALGIATRCRAAFLYMSSYVYGKPKYLPIDERHPVYPTNAYMGSKAIGELISEQICRMFDIPLVILRGFNIYGDCRIRGRLISDLLQSLRQAAPLAINDPRPRRDYLYIKDFSVLINKIISQKTVKGGLYNVGSGQSYSNREVAELIASLSRRREGIVITSRSRPNDILDCKADISSVRRAFSWAPQYSLEKGLDELIKSNFNRERGA